MSHGCHHDEASSLVAFLFVPSWAPVHDARAQAADRAPHALLIRLYERYAWEATGGDDGPNARPVATQPRHVLLAYAVPDLAALLLRDQACVRRAAAECRLEIAPLWSSQDPAADSIWFEATASEPNVVLAPR